MSEGPAWWEILDGAVDDFLFGGPAEDPEMGDSYPMVDSQDAAVDLAVTLDRPVRCWIVGHHGDELVPIKAYPSRRYRYTRVTD